MSGTFTTREEKIARGIYIAIFGKMPERACEIPEAIVSLAEKYGLTELDLEQLETEEPKLTTDAEKKITAIAENFGGIVAVSHTISRKTAKELSGAFAVLIEDYGKLINSFSNKTSGRYTFYVQKLEDLKVEKTDIDNYLDFLQ